MRLAVTAKTLDPPVVHVALLEPRQTFPSVACCTGANRPILTPGLTVDRVTGGDDGICADGDTASQSDKFKLVENCPTTLVVNNQGAKFPTDNLTPVTADVLRHAPNHRRLWVTN